MCSDMHTVLVTRDTQALKPQCPGFLLGLSHTDMVDHLCDWLLSPASLDIKLIPCGPRPPDKQKHSCQVGNSKDLEVYLWSWGKRPNLPLGKVNPVLHKEVILDQGGLSLGQIKGSNRWQRIRQKLNGLCIQGSISGILEEIHPRVWTKKSIHEEEDHTQGLDTGSLLLLRACPMMLEWLSLFHLKNPQLEWSNWKKIFFLIQPNRYLNYMGNDDWFGYLKVSKLHIASLGCTAGNYITDTPCVLMDRHRACM